MKHGMNNQIQGPIVDVGATIANGRNGEDFPNTGPNVWVNPTEWMPTGWGPPNVQQFQSGHSNNIPTNPSSEQGRGVGPERQWPHYPHAQNFNPYRGLNSFQRDGMDSYSPNVYRPENVAYWRIGLTQEMAVMHQKQRGAVTPVLNQPDSSSYTAIVANSNYYGDPFSAGYTPS